MKHPGPTLFILNKPAICRRRNVKLVKLETFFFTIITRMVGCWTPLPACTPLHHPRSLSSFRISEGSFVRLGSRSRPTTCYRGLSEAGYRWSWGSASRSPSPRSPCQSHHRHRWAPRGLGIELSWGFHGRMGMTGILYTCSHNRFRVKNRITRKEVPDWSRESSGLKSTGIYYQSF